MFKIKKTELQLKIELVRNEMIKIIIDDYKNIKSPKIIELSQELDKLIVEYLKLHDKPPV